MFIEPNTSWKNVYHESFDGEVPDDLLDGEIFYSLKEAKVIIEQWRKHCNQNDLVRPSIIGLQCRWPITQTPRFSIRNQQRSNLNLTFQLLQDICQVKVEVPLR